LHFLDQSISFREHSIKFAVKPDSCLGFLEVEKLPAHCVGRARHHVRHEIIDDLLSRFVELALQLFLYLLLVGLQFISEF
jgi:hypothetical protein